MQTSAGTADLAADQRQRNQTACVVGAMGVLRYAHTPENDGVLRARKAACHFAQRVGRDSTDRLHLLGGEIFHMLSELIKTFDIRLYILLIVEFLTNDDVEHAVEHGDVGAILELHHFPSVALERLPSRVHHH